MFVRRCAALFIVLFATWGSNMQWLERLFGNEAQHTWECIHRVAHAQALRAAELAWHRHKGTQMDLSAMAEAFLREHARVLNIGAKSL